MTALSSWFTALDPTLRIYWGIAIFASIVFTIQMAMSIIGLGDLGDSDLDTDFSGGDSDGLDDAGAMSLISIRNIIYFLLGLGWSGVCLWDSITNHIVLLAVSILVGCAFVAAFLFVFRQLMKLQQNGAVNIADAVGKACDVYLRIPASRTGIGKVQISLGGSIHEFDAMTDAPEAIPSGTKVYVSQLEGHALLVEPVKPLNP